METEKTQKDLKFKRISYDWLVLQNEKRHMLMESETMKLKERDEKHQTQLETWKAELGPRKKVRRG